MNIYRALGRVVSTRRKTLGLTQAALAAEAGLTRSSLANIETGRQKVLLHQVYAIARALRLDSMRSLVPDAVQPAEAPRPQPIDQANVTGMQKEQLEHAIALALGSRPVERRSS